MKKTLSLVLLSLLFSKVGYAEVDYGEYSEEYFQCIKENQQMGQYDMCYQEEYYRLKKQLDEIKIKLQQVPAFGMYNQGENSLIKNAEYMEKYGDLVCEYMQLASEKNDSLIACKLEQLNFLYVDLYKLYEAALNQNKMK